MKPSIQSSPKTQQGLPTQRPPEIESLWTHDGSIFQTISGKNPERYYYFRGLRPGATAVPPDDPRADHVHTRSDGTAVGISKIPGAHAPARIPIDKWPGRWQPAWPPPMDSLWDFVPKGELIHPREPTFVSRVIGRTRQGVRLLDTFTGTVSVVPRSQWPGDYLPNEQEDSKLIRAVLVGGEGGQHLDRLKEQATAIGIEIFYHVPGYKTRWKRGGWNYPNDADLAIVLTSHASHGLTVKATQLAKEEGIPAALLTSQNFQQQLWATMRDIYPDEFRSPYYYGALTAQKQAEPTWTWTGSDWELHGPEYAPLPFTGPPRERPPRNSDRPLAAGLVLVALVGGLWASK